MDDALKETNLTKLKHSNVVRKTASAGQKTRPGNQLNVRKTASADQKTHKKVHVAGSKHDHVTGSKRVHAIGSKKIHVPEDKWVHVTESKEDHTTKNKKDHVTEDKNDHATESKKDHVAANKDVPKKAAAAVSGRKFYVHVVSFHQKTLWYNSKLCADEKAAIDYMVMPLPVQICGLNLSEFKVHQNCSSRNYPE